MIVHDEVFRFIQYPQIIAVTTNSIAKRSGVLVMGRGSALEAVQHIPGIDREIADALRGRGFTLNGSQIYGWQVIRKPTSEKVGFAVAQSKLNWQDKSSLAAVTQTHAMLCSYALARPDIHIRLPMPGYGCGMIGSGVGVSRDELFALWENTPDNVFVCIRASDK